MKTYDTVTEAVNDLQLRGYTINFNLKPDCVESAEKHISIHPKDFEIDEVYRFEGNSDPGDESIVYAISSVKENVKGILVNAFGTYAETFSSELIAKLSSHIK